MSGFFIFIFIIVLLSISANFIFGLWDKRALRRIKETRSSLTREEYINNLTSMGYAKNHVEVVHDEIRRFIHLDGFPIYPEDNIHKIYRVGSLDDIELLDIICGKLKLRKAEQKDCNLLNLECKSFNAIYILRLTKKLGSEIK